MSAQISPNIVLGYRGQGTQQAGTTVLLSYDELLTVARKTVAGFECPWGAATSRQVEIRAPRPQAHKNDPATAAPWLAGQERNTSSASAWVLSRSIDRDRAAPWQHFTSRPLVERRVPWVLSHKQDAERASLWGQYAQQLALESTQPWVLSRKQDAERTGPWGQYAAWLSRSAGAGWATAAKADREQWHPWTRFSRTVHGDWMVVLTSAPSPNAPVVTVVVPIKGAYIVLNNASLRRVDGNIQLPTFGMSLSLDVDSWTWGFSASLPAEALADLEPASTGAPVEVEALINGVPYLALVESISRSRSFGKSAISVQGRGKSALLDTPYSPVSNFTHSVERTAQQLMGDVLSVNGVPLPWLVDWTLTDWLVPAGVFSHQGSYIGALGRIAESAGAYLQPHASDPAISVLARYPSTPWTWGGLIPDFELPSSVTTTEGIAWVEKARYNRVFVSGAQQGVLGQVTRTGTAGDLLAPMITDALITHADAARQRGLSVLANTGRQANITLKLPVLPETGIITPGKFVRYVDGATTRIGIVRSVGVEVASPEIFQTLGVETHVN